VNETEHTQKKIIAFNETCNKRTWQLQWNLWPGKHEIATSSWWRQLCFPHPLCRHCRRSFSLPVQATSSNQICPVLL